MLYEIPKLEILKTEIEDVICQSQSVYDETEVIPGEWGAE